MPLPVLRGGIRKDAVMKIADRMLIPLLNEACYGLYEGLGTAPDIDTGVRQVQRDLHAQLEQRLAELGRCELQVRVLGRGRTLGEAREALVPEGAQALPRDAPGSRSDGARARVGEAWALLALSLFEERDGEKARVAARALSLLALACSRDAAPPPH